MNRPVPGLTSNRFFLLSLLSFVVLAMVLAVVASAKRSQQAVPLSFKGVLISPGVRAMNSDNPWIKLQGARSIPTTRYQDEAGQAAADGSTNQVETHSLEGARSLSLTSSDFNDDGFPDLVCGYAMGNGGLVSIQLGNPVSYAPEDPEILQGIGRNQFPDPFLKNAGYVRLLERLDFLGTIDFDRDGHMDIVTAARGSNGMYLLSGNGHGRFSPAQRIALPGLVTAMVTGKVDQPDGSTSVVLGLNVPGGSAVVMFEGAGSLLESTPLIQELPAEASAFALGRLDEDQFDDLAILAGGQVMILHGRDQSQADSLYANKRARQSELIALPFAVRAMAVGEFIWDRESRLELATLDDNGSVHILARGELDTRPWTPGEIFERRLEMQRIRDKAEKARKKGGPAMMVATGTSTEALRWEVVEDLPAPQTDSLSTAPATSEGGASEPLLLSTRISSLPSDDLLVLNPARQLQVFYRKEPRQGDAQLASKSVGRSSVSLESDDEVTAVLPMRVNVDARPGLVVMSKGKALPSVIMPLAGSSFTVTRADDPAPNGCAVGDCSLREAIIAANVDVGADTILFNAGINPTLSIVSGGGHEDAAATGDLDINSNVTITGNSPTVISTNYTNTCGDCKVFGVNQTGAFNGLSVSFTGVTIQNGFNDGTNFSGSFFETGGGIDFFMTGSGNNHSMTNCTVTNNRTQNGARSHGGGVNVDGANTASPGGPSGGTISFTSCTISNNTATADGGGGMFLAADKHDATLTNCVVTGNSNTGATGGGMQITHSFGGTVTVTGASGSVSNNTAATNGGGIVVTFNQVTNISNITISNNTATGAGGSSLGGGVLIDTLGAMGVTGSTSLTGVTISNNHANNGVNAAAGGVRYGGFYAATMSGCTVSGNTSKNGAGVANTGSTQTPAATLAISGGSFTGNAATGDGGGFASTGTGSPTASVTTFSNVAIGGTGVGQPNTAVNGGGIADTQTGSVTVTNNSIAGNSATTNGGGVFISGGSVTLDGVTVDSNAATTGDGLHQSAGTFSAANTVNFNSGDSINIAGGTFTSTAGTLNLTGSFTRAAAATFNHNNGTFNFNGSGAQNINGTATSEAFNTFIVNKSGGTLATGGSTVTISTNALTMTAGSFTAPATLDINGNLTLNGGTLTAGTNITAAANWTNNGGAFTQGANTVTFDGGGAQAINGTAASQTFNHFTVNKGGGTLSIGGSTTTLNVGGNFLLSAGTFAQSASALNVTGNLTTSVGTTFTKATGGQSLTFNNNASQNWTDNTAGLQDFGAVVIGGSNNTVTLQTNIRMTALTVNSGDTLFLNGKNFAFSAAAAATNNGTIRLIGTEATLTNVSNFGTSAGTVEYVGRNVAETLTIKDFGATDYFNLAINDTHVTKATFNLGSGLSLAGDLLLASGTLSPGANGIALSGNWTNNGGTFTPGSSTVTFNNTTGGQSINGSATSQTFFNVTMTKSAQSLTVGGSTNTLSLNTLILNSGTFSVGTATTINVSGDWSNNGATFTPGSGTVVFNSTTAAQNMNGTAASQTFNNLTVSKSGQTLTGGGSTTSLTLNGNLSITAGTFAAGTITTMNVAGNWANGGSFTAGASNTVVFNGNNNTQTLSGNTTFNNLTINHTGTGNVTASGSTVGATGLLRVQSGTFISSSSYNNVQIDSGTTLQSDGGTISVSGNWVNNGTFTPAGGTVNFNGAGAQSISGTATTETFNNFTVNKSGGSTLSIAANFTTLDVNGNLTLTLGTFAAGTATAITVGGNWANNGGGFTPGTGTVTFDGGVGQTIGGTTATTFNNLTNANLAGLTLAQNETVNGILDLSGSDINTGAFTLTMPASGSSTGTFDVVGNVKRSGFITGGGNTLSFGNPLNQITINSGTVPTDINVNLVKAAPAGFATAVQRTYTITPNGGANISATLRLRYLDSELNGNTEDANLIFRRFNGVGWAPVVPTSSDFAANWLQATGVTTFSPWTFSSAGSPTATNGVVTGRIVDGDGNPVEGTAINLSGTQTRKTITDANGNYRFENVETTGFYTVRATRVNYTFSPQERSFSQIGNQTEAVFTATASATVNANPVDTAEYFVRQHYVDFLGREPDEAGFNFWSDQILGCNGDAHCAEVKRINVSAAYFLSIEFQTTGGLVDGLYRASFDRAPQYAEFMPDTAAVAKDVVVGRAGWEQRLAANRQAFLDAFVQRPAFQATYGSLNNTQYVGTLLTHTRIIWTQAERDALVNGLASGSLSRAGVLGQIASDQRFVDAKFNQAFVMMEYFGYLRRDPDAAGYQFWLNKLNQFGGNFEQAEMVKAFIVSGEYRGRFPR